MKRPNLKIGEILINEKLLTPEDLEKALQEQKRKKGKFLGVFLVEMGLVKEEDIASALGKQLGIPYTQSPELLMPSMGQGLEKLLPLEFARQNALIPLSREGNKLKIAMADPLDFVTIDNVHQMTRCEVEVVVSTKSGILKMLETLSTGGIPARQTAKETVSIPTGASESLGKMIIVSGKAGEKTIDQLKAAIAASGEQIEKPTEQEAGYKGFGITDLTKMAESAPIIRLVNLILLNAIEDRASDIHIEAMKDQVNIRYRIDGVLYEIAPPPKHLLAPVVSRIKIMSGLDIAEKRLPQDGAISVKYQDREIDLRVSTIPTVYGEKVVMRLLDRGNLRPDIKTLGFEPMQLEIFQMGIVRPHGLVIITGPTGSGKTTTLYSGLHFLNTPKKNVLTVEDPVEYKLPGINQVQVKPEIGLTFAMALRAFLRQDPDIVMVGEVRDLETAQICVRAALTGHLVLSTLHTNDAVGAIPRLIDMGIDAYLVAAALNVLAAQRLVRKLCPECKEAYEPEKEIVGKYGVHADLLYKSKGCEKCNFIGYKGRVPIYEVLAVSQNVKQMILKGASVYDLKQTASSEGLTTLRESGMKKVERGLTTLEEVLQVTLEEND